MLKITSKNEKNDELLIFLKNLKRYKIKKNKK